MAVPYTFLLKRSSIPGYIPTVSSLQFGELAINYGDGRLFFRDKANNIQYFSANNAADFDYSKANSAISIATAAYGKANLAYSVANSSLLIAQSASDKANLSLVVATSAETKSNSAMSLANSFASSISAANDQANSAVSTAIYSSGISNSAIQIANASNIIANNARNVADFGYIQANSAYTKANASYSLSQEAFNSANTKFPKGNTLNFLNGTAVGVISEETNIDLFGSGNYVPRINYSNSSLVYANQTSVIISFPDSSNNWSFEPSGKTHFPNDLLLTGSGKPLTIQGDNFLKLYWKSSANGRPGNPTEAYFKLDSSAVVLSSTRLDRNLNPVNSVWTWSHDGSFSTPNNQVQINSTKITLAADDNLSVPLISGATGEKLILRDQAVDGKYSQAIGLEEGYIWFSQDTFDDANNGFKFYSEGIPVVTIGGQGSISIGDPSGTPYTLPNADGSNTQILSTNGAGQVSWVDKFQSGEVIKMMMLPYNTIHQASGNTAAPNNTSWNNIAFYNYTFASSNSYLIAEYNTVWTTNNNAAGNDTVTANLALNGTSFSYSWQPATSSTNEGQRASTLFPIMGRANSTGEGTTANVQVFFQRTSTDDTYYIYGDSSTWLKLTEVAQ